MRHTPVWTLLLLAACAGADANLLVTPPPPPPPPAPVSFRLSVHPFNGGVVGAGPGSVLQLTPRIIASTGDTLALTASVAYSSRVPAVITVDDAGLVTVVATSGSSTIHASTVYAGQTLADTLSIQVVCTAELTAVVTPFQPVMAVGERFTPTISLTTCSGHVTLHPVITWAALDPTIVSVNPVTGETVALKAGATTVTAMAAGIPGPVSGIDVTVH